MMATFITEEASLIVLSDGQWISVYSDVYTDVNRREVLATVPVRATDRHGNVVSLSDPAVSAALEDIPRTPTLF